MRGGITCTGLASFSTIESVSGRSEREAERRRRRGAFADHRLIREHDPPAAAAATAAVPESPRTLADSGISLARRASTAPRAIRVAARRAATGARRRCGSILPGAAVAAARAAAATAAIRGDHAGVDDRRRLQEHGAARATAGACEILEGAALAAAAATAAGVD